MNNLLLTLATGVIFIIIVSSALRFFSSLKSIPSALVIFFAVSSIYIPLGVTDWPGIDVFAIQFAIYGITLYFLTILHSQAIEVKQKEAAGILVEKKWHWGPFAIISFFVTLVIIESVFITIAQKGSDSLLSGIPVPEPKSGAGVSSYFPGIIEHNFHEREDKYNEYQKRLNEQRQRGWGIKYGWLKTPFVNQTATFQLSLRNAKKQAITNATVRGTFQRGNTSSRDQPIILKEFEAGLYRGDITLEYPGRWELKLVLESPQGDYYLNSTTTVSE